MNTTLIAMGISLMVVLGLVINLGVLSLLSGAFYFLFGKPKLKILKTENGDSGFSFAFAWNNAREPIRFDSIRVRLFNPFSVPSSLDVIQEFSPQDDDFSFDLDMGPIMKKIVSQKKLDSSTVQIDVLSSKSGQTHQFKMTGNKFLDNYNNSKITLLEHADKKKRLTSTNYYHQNTRSFISPALPESEHKALKIPSNPVFAGEFAASPAGGSVAPVLADFLVEKVWIEDGCIVCDACEAIYPEVFDVTETTCLIRPDAPLDHGLLVSEAADACPVEVIKFKKGS